MAQNVMITGTGRKHPGWVRTNEGNAKAPLSSYEAATILSELFEKKRDDKTGPRFVTNDGVEYPY